MRHQCNGWSTPTPTRKQYGAVDPAIYSSPEVVFSHESKIKGFCLNPACNQKLNSYNLKPPFLCHRCQKLQREGFLAIFANSENIIGIPAEGAAIQYTDLTFVVNFRKNGFPVTTSLAE